MAITSEDALIQAFVPYPVDANKDASTAEAAGIKHCLWYVTGNPGAGAAPGGGLNGATFVGPVTGALPYPAAVAGKTPYLARADFSQGANAACVEIYDKLWGNVPVVTTTGAQAITSLTWPARDAVGATNGAQVRLFLECSSATGNGAPITNTTVSYTNDAGTAGRTATLPSFPATAVAGTFVPFNLAAGDSGVRSIQSITLGTSYVSGAIHLVAARFIARIPLPSASVPVDRDWMALLLPAVYDNPVLFLAVMPTGTAIGAILGSASYAQG